MKQTSKHVIFSLVYVLLIQLSFGQDPKPCNVDNRGWLTNAADRGVHPVTLFGPLGLHGEHKMLTDFSNSGITIRVSEKEGDDDGGMSQSGSSSYDPLSLTGNEGLLPVQYYPGRTYRISLTCTKVCAFLASVEKGTRADSYSVTDTSVRAGLQVGTVESSTLSSVAPLKIYSGIFTYTSVTNDLSGDLGLGTTYSYNWIAPTWEELGYQNLTVRFTVVQDNTLECEGKYYEYPLPSLVQCGDGIKDTLEMCDDGNQVDGDGCSSSCTIELGWSCAELVDSSTAPYKMSKCTQAGVIVTPTALTIVEGQTASYTVQLTIPIQQGSEVFVSIISTAVGVFLSKDTLRFNSDDALIAQSVLVTSVSNDNRDFNRDIVIEHIVSTSDDNYGNATAENVAATIIDDDVANIVLSKSDITLAENGQAAEYTISLTSQPFSTVVISVVPSVTGQLVILPQQVVVGPQDWQTAHKVTLFAVDNTVVEGRVDLTLSHSISASLDTAYEALNLDNIIYKIQVHVEDNDIPGITVEPRSLQITEGDTASLDHYNISLQSQMLPGTTVTVKFETSCPLNQTHVFCSLMAKSENDTSYVTFDETDWNQKKKVFVTTQNNDVAANVSYGTIVHEVESNDNSYATLNTTALLYPYPVEIEILEDDIPGFHHQEVIYLEEGQGETVLSVTLMSQPTHEVEVIWTLYDDIGNLYISPHRLFFDHVVWQEPRYLSIATMFDDFVQKEQINATLGLMSWSQDPTYQMLLDKNVSIILQDDDIADIMIDIEGNFGNFITVAEGGEQEQFTIHLRSNPRSPVTVNLIPSSQISVTPATLTFTSNNWSNKQSVAVRAIDDTAVELAVHQGVIRFNLTSGDPFYNNLQVADMRVDIEDNDFVTVSQEVGPWGTVMSPTFPAGAATLNIPGGVLDTSITLQMSEDEKPVDGTPANAEVISGSNNEYRRVSGTYAFEPHGTQFGLPVYITLQYSEEAYASVNSNDNTTRLVFLRKANETAGWEQISGGKFSNGIGTIAVTTFSYYKVAVEKLTIENVPESTSGLDALDIAKCINGFDLTVVDGRATFDNDVQLNVTESECPVQECKSDKDLTLVLILAIVLGVETILLIIIVIFLTKKRKIQAQPIGNALAIAGTSNTVAEYKTTGDSII